MQLSDITWDGCIIYFSSQSIPRVLSLFATGILSYIRCKDNQWLHTTYIWVKGSHVALQSKTDLAMNWNVADFTIKTKKLNKNFSRKSVSSLGL